MSSRLITAPASRVSPGDFFRAVTGLPPMERAEVAEREALAARWRLIATIEKVEFARANREREAIIRDGIENGTGDYAAYIERSNRPFTEARERVDAWLAQYDRARAA